MTELLPVQIAIYSLLAGPSGGPYPVYDVVPQRAPYPRIVIGDVDAAADEEIEALSLDGTVLLHVWSRDQGKDESYEVLEFIKSVLNGVEAPDGEWWAMTWEGDNVLEDPKSTPDARLFHAVSRYRFRTN